MSLSVSILPNNNSKSLSLITDVSTKSSKEDSQVLVHSSVLDQYLDFKDFF